MRTRKRRPEAAACGFSTDVRGMVVAEDMSGGTPSDLRDFEPTPTAA
jgi:hypothetical protein